MFTTLDDRNLLSFSVNAGLTVHQPFAGRDSDVFGLGFGVAQVSGAAANFDQDIQLFQPEVFTPVQGAETFLEATYQWQVLKSVQIQPDIQYIINPGGDREPQRPDAEGQERAGARRENEHHVLKRGFGFDSGGPFAQNC